MSEPSSPEEAADEVRALCAKDWSERQLWGESDPIAAYIRARDDAILAMCEKIARDGAELVAGMSIKFVTPQQMASDLANDIADNIAALRDGNIGESEERTSA